MFVSSRRSAPVEKTLSLRLAAGGREVYASTSDRGYNLHLALTVEDFWEFRSMAGVEVFRRVPVVTSFIIRLLGWANISGSWPSSTMSRDVIMLEAISR